MFTGLIEHVGRVLSAAHGERESRLEIDLGPLAEGTRIGDSIATNGICLTAAALQGARMQCFASAETRRKTTLEAWKAGTTVNLERALKLGDRLGGHLVMGHVDGVGRLVERAKEGDGERFTFILPEHGVRAVEKGSIAVDGISLTSWDCRGARVSVAAIPHTIANTTLAHLRPGDRVNLEEDPIGRWVERLMKDREG
jgi:riboflavin synthase